MKRMRSDGFSWLGWMSVLSRVSLRGVRRVSVMFIFSLFSMCCLKTRGAVNQNKGCGNSFAMPVNEKRMEMADLLSNSRQ